MHGAVAAVVAAIALWLGVTLAGDQIASVIAGALGNVELALPAASAVLVFIAIGAGLGAVGGGLAGATR
jgi:hypothetical protein